MALLIKLILQNKGKLSKGKRTAFAEISDEEIDRIERGVWRAWHDVHPTETRERPPLADEEGDLNHNQVQADEYTEAATIRNP